MLDKLFQFIIARARLVLLLAALLVLLAIGILPQVKFDNSVENYILADDPDLVYFKEFRNLYGSDEVLVVALENLDPFSADGVRMLDLVTRRIELLPSIERASSLTNVEDIVGSEDYFEVLQLYDGDPENFWRWKKYILEQPLYRDIVISKDGRVAAIVIKLEHREGDDDYKRVLIERLRALLGQVLPEGVNYYIAGIPLNKVVIAETSQHDLRTFVPITSCCLIIMLALILRNFWLVPVVKIGVWASVLLTMGYLITAGYKINNIVAALPSLILAYAVSDAIHIIMRYREVLRDPDISNHDALFATLQSVVVPCFFTSVTTAAGFFSLTFTQIPPIRDFGHLAAVGVLISFVAVLFTVPPLLAQMPRLAPMVLSDKKSSRLLLRLLRAVADYDLYHNANIGFLVLGVLMFSLFGISMLKVETNTVDYFGKDTFLWRSAAFVEQNLAGTTPLEVVIETGIPDGIKDPELLAEIAKITAYLEGLSGVDNVLSINTFLKEMNRSFHNEDPEWYKLPEQRGAVAQFMELYAGSSSSNLLEELCDFEYSQTRISVRGSIHNSRQIAALVDDVRAFVAECDPRWQYRVTSYSVIYANMVDALVSGQLRSLALAGIFVAIMMVIYSRSISLGLLAMVPNALPVVMSMGLMGWLGIPLSIATAMISSVGIGIAVDDTIHFLARYKRELAAGKSTKEAVYITQNTTGQAMAFTSVVLFMGFIVLVLSSFLPTVYFGALLAFTMLAAILGDLVVLPYLLIMMDNARTWRRRRAL